MKAQSQNNYNQSNQYNKSNQSNQVSINKKDQFKLIKNVGRGTFGSVYLWYNYYIIYSSSSHCKEKKYPAYDLALKQYFCNACPKVVHLEVLILKHIT